MGNKLEIGDLVKTKYSIASRSGEEWIESGDFGIILSIVKSSDYRVYFFDSRIETLCYDHFLEGI